MLDQAQYLSHTLRKRIHYRFEVLACHSQRLQVSYKTKISSDVLSLTPLAWFFNFLLAITWPSLLKAFRPQGAFAFYGVWNLVFEGLVYLFVPETKGRSLEELDQVFGVPTSARATYGVQRIWYFVQSYVLRRNDVKEVTLCNEKDDSDDNSSA